MLNNDEFNKIKNALSYAQNRSGMMKSFGISPSYSMLIQFLNGDKDSIVNSKMQLIYDKLGYESHSLIIKKENIEVRKKIHDLKNKEFKVFIDELKEHASTFKFKPKKVSTRKRGDSNLVMNCLKSAFDLEEKLSKSKDHFDLEARRIDESDIDVLDKRKNNISKIQELQSQMSEIPDF